MYDQGKYTLQAKYDAVSQSMVMKLLQKVFSKKESRILRKPELGGSIFLPALGSVLEFWLGNDGKWLSSVAY